MKEERYFFVPNATENNELPPEEALHAYKVLRLKEGQNVILIDGKSYFHLAKLTLVTHKSVTFTILKSDFHEKEWQGSLQLAIAPTKNFDRMEWLAEKCTEIGFDTLTFLNCHNSERRKVKLDRINKVIISAVKQSRKPYLPKVNDIIDFQQFINQPIKGRKFICHCHEEIQRNELLEDFNHLNPSDDVTVLVGPEGDFSPEEVWKAINCGFTSVTLGTFRLRTETAGVMAVSMYSLANRSKKTI